MWNFIKYAMNPGLPSDIVVEDEEDDAASEYSESDYSEPLHGIIVLIPAAIASRFLLLLLLPCFRRSFFAILSVIFAILVCRGLTNALYSFSSITCGVGTDDQLIV